MKWKLFVANKLHLSQRAIVSIMVGVLVPSATAVTFAATNQFHSSVASSSIGTSSISSSNVSSINNVSNISSNIVSSDSTSSSATSSYKTGGNTTEDLDAIKQATNDGLKKINSAASKALDDIDSAKKTVSSSTSSDSGTSSVTKNNSSPKVVNYTVCDPYHRHVGGYNPGMEKYQSTVDFYNDFAIKNNVKPDAGKVLPCDSEAQKAWFKANPQYDY